MSHKSHGAQPQVPWMVISVIFYVVTFILLLAAAIFIGGPITAGLLVWFGVLVAHSFIYVCTSKRSQDH